MKQRIFSHFQDYLIQYSGGFRGGRDPNPRKSATARLVPITTVIKTHYKTNIAKCSEIWGFILMYHAWEGYLRKIPVERRKISRAERGVFA
jgi:hypothetical protein